jgi:hypothetical protein
VRQSKTERLRKLTVLLVNRTKGLIVLIDKDALFFHEFGLFDIIIGQINGCHCGSR